MMLLRLDAGSPRLCGSEARGWANAGCSWRACNELLGGNVGGERARAWMGVKGAERRREALVVKASSANSVATGVVKTNKYKINLDEYMVTLEKPIGIRFAQTLSGNVYVEALAKKVKFSTFGSILSRGGKVLVSWEEFCLVR